MMSNSIFPNRLTKVDDLLLENHWQLDSTDRCYFLVEYTVRQGYNFSAANQFIHNFKKSMEKRRFPYEWRHKQKAIQDAAAAFRRILDPHDLDRLTFVPIPPSASKGDPLHDDRLIQMLRAIRPDPPVDIRELIIQTASTEPVHGSSVRLTSDEIRELYRIDGALAEPAPGSIVVVDDILTTGAHFRAAKSILSTYFPAAKAVGLFIARAVRDPNIPDF